MDLNDFGTQACTGPRANNNQQNYYHPPGYFPGAEVGNRPVQWKVVQAGVFEVCGVTAEQLPAGAYGCTLNQYGEVQLIARDLQVDDLIDFADSLPSKILHEIESSGTSATNSRSTATCTAAAICSTARKARAKARSYTRWSTASSRRATSRSSASTPAS